MYHSCARAVPLHPLNAVPACLLHAPTSTPHLRPISRWQRREVLGQRTSTSVNMASAWLNGVSYTTTATGSPMTYVVPPVSKSLAYIQSSQATTNLTSCRAELADRTAADHYDCQGACASSPSPAGETTAALDMAVAQSLVAPRRTRSLEKLK